MVISAGGGAFSFEVLRCLPSNPPELRRSFSRAAASFMSRSSSGFSNGGSSGARIWRACARLTLSAAVSLPIACASRGGDGGKTGRVRASSEPREKSNTTMLIRKCYSRRGRGTFAGVVTGMGRTFCSTSASFNRADRDVVTTCAVAIVFRRGVR